MNELNNLLFNNLKKIIQEISSENIEIIIERPKQEPNAHLSTSIALSSAKKMNKKPREIAEIIKQKLEETNNYKEITIAGPGFINVLFNDDLVQNVIKTVMLQKEKFGSSPKKNFIFNLEEVSANPTGFLHVGHARNAAISDSTARILKFAGYEVQTEYYINDAGNQINILAITILYNYQLLLNKKVETPEEIYGGDMYIEVAKKFVDKYGDKFIDCTWSENKINNEETAKIFKEESTNYFLAIIKDQLKLFNVSIDFWSSEKKSIEENQIEKMLKKYAELGAAYKKDGAVWLKTTDLGDDKDRVLIKSNGDYTYITPDLATHHERIQRSKANKLVNFWGGDHHGYIVRMCAGLALLGHPQDILDIDMIQMVRLVKDGQEYKMSKRKGTAVWLIDLLEMVGPDALRYMLASKNPASHMDFDLDLVTAKNSSNPVFYAQYATARIANILIQAEKNNIKPSATNLSLLTNSKELQMMITLDLFNKNVESAAKSRLPHIITEYIQTLTKQFHSYYAEKDIKIVDLNNIELSSQRITLIKALEQVFSNSFNLIGISVVEQM
ncbi:arginine--tRNA ligase [Spiroplasma endosymbiont of Labia minor]|uniref:arginine--tRNA ligase n=1 Tax=Spiroplasma endosymbiont of Labia minor TaxID=3066305 RepID=UPI0030CB5117